MDPNATLGRLRDLLGEHDKPISADEAREAGELFTSLDEWLSRGGFLPWEWERPITAGGKVVRQH